MDRADYNAESPETRARLDAACCSFGGDRQPVVMTVAELFGSDYERVVCELSESAADAMAATPTLAERRAKLAALRMARDGVYRPQPSEVPHAAATGSVLAALAQMTPAEVRQTFVDAEIVDERGLLTEAYSAEPQPDAGGACPECGGHGWEWQYDPEQGRTDTKTDCGFCDGTGRAKGGGHG